MSEKIDFEDQELLIDVIIEGEVVPYTMPLLIKKYGAKTAGKMALEGAKHGAIAALDQQHAALLRKLTGNATIEERDTWQKKELAALAVKEGKATEGQVLMIATEAGYLGTTPAKLADTILAKGAAFEKLIGLAAGVRGKARAAISAAKTPAALQKAIGEGQASAAEALALIANA